MTSKDKELKGCGKEWKIYKNPLYSNDYWIAECGKPLIGEKTKEGIISKQETTCTDCEKQISDKELIFCFDCCKAYSDNAFKEGRQKEREEMINELMTELYVLFKRQEDDVSLYDIQVLLYEKIQERIKKINKKEEENDTTNSTNNRNST